MDGALRMPELIAAGPSCTIMDALKGNVLVGMPELLQQGPAMQDDPLEVIPLKHMQTSGAQNMQF